MNTFERQAHEDRVAERLKNLAQAAAERSALERAYRALEFFNTNPTFQRKPKLLIDKLVHRLYDKEYPRALARFPAEREAGLHNDPESLAPGLKAVITAKGVAEFSSMAGNAGRRPGVMGPTLLRLLVNSGESAETIEKIKGQPISDEEWASYLASNSNLVPNFYPKNDDGLYSLSLPSGAYRHVDAGTAVEGIIFHPHATFSNGRMVNSYAGFKLPVDGIVRIEGAKQGEFWQNPAYTPTGELRAEA